MPFGIVECDRKQCFANEDGLCNVLRQKFKSSRSCPFYKKKSECTQFVPYIDEQQVLDRLNQIKIAKEAQLRRIEAFASDREYERTGILRANGGVQYNGVKNKK